jgi:hypothetical protein
MVPDGGERLPQPGAGRVLTVQVVDHLGTADRAARSVVRAFRELPPWLPLRREVTWRPWRH